jgi:hypothetical protein
VRLCDTYAVQAYNTGIQQFPTALFATALNYTPHEFFNVGEDRKMVDQAQAVKLWCRRAAFLALSGRVLRR